MDYQEELQKIYNAAESGNVSVLEDVKNNIESDRVNGENMGNAMVLMAAEQALQKLAQKKESVIQTPQWRVDQALRTGGSIEEIDRITHDINQKTEKSVLQGWHTILSNIPASMRTVDQQQQIQDLEQELGIITKHAEQKARGVIAEQQETARVAENLEKLDLNKINPVDTAMNESLGMYTENVSSQIASGTSLWDIPADDSNDEPVSFTDRIQPSKQSVDDSHKEYPYSEIDKIGLSISAGFGNEQALNRGIELEKKLDVYNQQSIPVEQNTINTSTEVPNQIINTELETKEIKSDFENIITSLTRDELGSLYGILQNHGPIDGQNPDQIWAAVKLFMRGASDDSHIPESFGLRSKMNEIKKIRDTELAHHGIVIDKESGAVTVQKNSETGTWSEISKVSESVLEDIPVNTTQEVQNESVIGEQPSNRLENITIEPDSIITNPENTAQDSKDELESIIEESEPIISTIPQKQTPENLFVGISKDIHSIEKINSELNFFKTPSSEYVTKLKEKNSFEERLNVLESLNLIQPIEINGKKYNAVDYSGRVMVISKIGNFKIPFYISTGSAGKKTVETGKWYAVFGIGDDGWINKGTEDLINSQYNHPALQKIAKILNEGVGNISLRDETGKIKENYHFLSDDETDQFNKNLEWSSKPASNNGDGYFWEHTKNILEKLNTELSAMQNLYEKERNISEVSRFNGVKSFEDLYSIIDKTNEIMGSSQLFEAGTLKEIINKVRNGELDISYITRQDGLREVVSNLLKQESVK